MRRPIIMAILATYLIISFVPQLGLMNVLGKGKKK